MFIFLSYIYCLLETVSWVNMSCHWKSPFTSMLLCFLLPYIPFFFLETYDDFDSRVIEVSALQILTQNVGIGYHGINPAQKGMSAHLAKSVVLKKQGRHDAVA